jgi:phage terminase large subunit-like protein
MFNGYPNSQDAHDYALSVVNGGIPNCKDAINSCQRFLSDIDREDFKYEFDPVLAERAVRFIETLPHTKGKWAAKGECLKLESWQKFIVVNLFGWVDKVDGLRRFREAYINVARKNGKSVIAAAIALYMLVADNETGSEVYCGATNEKQALEVFKPARLMAIKRTALCSRFDIEINARSLAIPSDGSKFEPVIGNPGDGASPHLWIVDEYHEHPDSSQVDTATTGMGAREQPMLLIITTAGTDTSSPCYDKHREIQKILSGLVYGDDVERIFGIIYSVDKKDDWTDPSVLQKANPNYNISVNGEYLRTQQASAIRNSKNQNKFLIKHLNKWVNARESWLTAMAWQNCAKNLNEEYFSDIPMVVALDLASKRDICSFMRIYYKDLDNGRNYYIFGHHFLPGERIKDDDANNSYASWVTDGYLTIAGEFETELDEVEECVIEFLNVGNVREVTYDPWKATQMAQRLQNSGCDIVEFRQNAQMMSPAMDEVDAAICAGRLHHDGCPVLTWMAGNVVMKPYKTDFKTPTKEKPQYKIDGMVALIMGVGRAMYDVTDDDSSVYDDRGVRVL